MKFHKEHLQKGEEFVGYCKGNDISIRSFVITTIIVIIMIIIIITTCYYLFIIIVFP